jgi:hypothetical protein
MWLPRWLYEGLPALYMAGGIAALGLLGHSQPAIVSACLFFLAAGLVARWRRTSRRAEEVQLHAEAVPKQRITSRASPRGTRSCRATR